MVWLGFLVLFLKSDYQTFYFVSDTRKSGLGLVSSGQGLEGQGQGNDLDCASLYAFQVHKGIYKRVPFVYAHYAVSPVRLSRKAGL